MPNIIVITHPEEVNDEINICKELFEAGLETLHVRKPHWSEQRTSEFLKQFTNEELARMSVHHQTNLCDKFRLGGSHVSFSAVMTTKRKEDLAFSCSAHNWQEAEIAFQYCDYVFISPVFDSISKNDYRKNNALSIIPSQLKEQKLFALGGINEHTISEAFEIGYSGAVVLGHIWNEPKKAIQNFRNLNQFVNA